MHQGQRSLKSQHPRKVRLTERGTKAFPALARLLAEETERDMPDNDAVELGVGVRAIHPWVIHGREILAHGPAVALHIPSSGTADAERSAA